MNYLLLFLSLLLPLVAKGQIETPGSGAGGGGGGGGASSNLLWASTIFVDATNGDDSTATRGDAAKPYKTASNAVYAAQSGDTVLFRPGDHYVVTAPSQNWLTNAPLRVVGKTNVTIAGLEGSRLILTNVGTLFWVGRATNITFRDLHLIGTVSNSVVADQSAAIWAEGDVRSANFLNLKIHNWHSQGISTFLTDGGTWGFSDWLVDGCDFYKVGNTNGYLAQAYDGTALVFCGQRLTAANNTFRECWRAFESYNWPDATGTNAGKNEFFRDMVFANNKFIEIMEHAFKLIGTNQQNYSFIGNHFIKTNKTLGADYSYDISAAIYFYSASNFIISGNQFIGQRMAIEWPFEGNGLLPQASDIMIQNNMFRDTRDIAVYFWGNNYGTANPRRLTRVSAIGNTVIDADAAFIINGNDCRIQENIIMNTPRSDTRWGAIAVGWHFSVPENAVRVTNVVISGNLIQVNDATNRTITIGTNAYNTRVYNNRITKGQAINNLGIDTLGLNSGKLNIDSGVLTSNNPAIDISQTWSNSGVTFTGLVFNATDTSSSSGSRMFVYTLGGAHRMSLEKAGQLVVGTSATDSHVSLGYAGLAIRDASGQYFSSSPTDIALRNTIKLGFGSTTAPSASDAFLMRDSAATLQLGADAATATAQTLKAHDGSGSNITGADLNVAGGQGTGTGPGGAINFKTAPAGSSGSSLNAYVTRFSIDSTGLINAPEFTTSNLTYQSKSLTASTNMTIDLKGGSMQYVTMTADTVLAVTNVAAGRNISVMFIGPTNSQYNLIMPSSIRLYSGAVTNIVTTNKSAVVSFTSFDGVSTNLVTTVAIEP